MDSNTYDALIIGCGPGGSSAATFLAQAGKRVLTLEKEIFPRFHIGESLLPGNHTIFREMGILPKLQEAGFLRKIGARFELSNGSKGTTFNFGDGRFNREPEAIHVERSIFDHVLLKHARASGADVREGWTVQHVASDADGVTVEARSPENQTHKFRASFLVDASGRGNFTGNQEGQRVIHPKHKKLAVFGHFLNVDLPPVPQRTETIIVRLPNKWFWIIPLSAEKTSVGLVIDKDEFARANANAKVEEIFHHWVQASPVVKSRMNGASLVGSMQTTTDFSYYNRRLAGPRLLRVGDAAGFMDPIFSAGVFLAMWSGKLAAQYVIESLHRGDELRFAQYEKRVRRGLRFYWRVVENYYTTPFMELFLNPSDHFDLASAVIAVLAGEVEGCWALRWRVEYFFWLVKLQARWPLVPRISFA